MTRFSKRAADADLRQEVPAVPEEPGSRDRHWKNGTRDVVLAGNLRFLRLGVDRYTEAARKGEPPSVDRLRPEHETEPRRRQIQVLVVSVEGEPFVTGVSLEKVAAKGPAL